MPRVSIIMATYNRAALLHKAVESVMRQTMKDWELIIINDASSDDTQNKLAELRARDKRIITLANEVNLGISKTYNKGFRVAKGEFIAMIDDDDAWIPDNKLEKQVRFLGSHSDYVGCGGGVIAVATEGKELYRYLKPERDEEIRRYMLFSNPMANSTTVFRREVGEKVGWYDESIRYAGDRDFWLKMGLQGKLCNVPDYFSYYTKGTANTSIARMRPHLKTAFMVMRRYKGKYPRYTAAFCANLIQYWYAFLPAGIRNASHTTAARVKRMLFK
ncbi:MAG: glycosyltransferase [Patescibacteria group bacterium]|nr:glycosyltransferase [Patescibacteria group bacterium]